MSQLTDDMLASGLPGITWRKSRHSNPSGSCVELAALPNGGIAVRNSRYPRGSVLVCTRTALAAIIEAAKNGEFDNALHVH